MWFIRGSVDGRIIDGQVPRRGRGARSMRQRRHIVLEWGEGVLLVMLVVCGFGVDGSGLG